MEWAKEFRQRNPQWATDLKELKRDLELLFTDSLTQLKSFPKDADKHLRRTAERRLRFAANRLGLLGLDQVHDRLREILCLRPDILRNPQRLLDDLARQAYASDVLEVLDFHSASSSESAPFMRAMSVKALRLLPRLEEDLWQRLVHLMFEDDEITRLMATETWLILASKLKETPLETMVRERAIACLQAPQGVSRRLLKNYVLVLGVVDHHVLSDLPIDHNADPILILAHSIASQGKARNVFASVEPEVLRRKYYSTRYDDYDGDGGPYLGRAWAGCGRRCSSGRLRGGWWRRMRGMGGELSSASEDTVEPIWSISAIKTAAL